MFRCVPQLRNKFPCTDGVDVLQSIAAGIGISNFLGAFFIKRLNSSPSGSKNLALSSFGFSISHFCFSLRFDVSGLEVVCFLVSLPPDNENPSCGFSIDTVNLVKPVHASDSSRSSSTFQ